MWTMPSVLAPRETTLRDYKERLLRVLVHIQQRLDEPLPLAELAQLACLSPYHFHRVFTGMLGESVASHIRRLRLERAATNLKLSNQPIVQIALAAGYETHEAFTRAFRMAFGVSPTQYRRRLEARALVPAPSGVHYQNTAPLRRFRALRPGERTMKVTIKHLEPKRVAFMRHIGPYHDVGRTWDKFCTFLGKEGLLGGEAQFFGISHDDPDVTPRDKLRYDACLTVDEKFRPQGEIGVQVTPGGEYAVLTHFGPYDKLNESYAQLLGQWLPRSGRSLSSTPCLEVYLNSPENTAPQDLITDIYAPLEPRP